MKTVVLFDVNETPLDVAALDPLFTRMFGDAVVRRDLPFEDSPALAKVDNVMTR